MPEHKDTKPVAGFRFHRHGRSTATGLAVIGWLAGLLVLWWLLAASPWLLLLLALPLLPALLDLWRNPSAGLDLDARRITWHTGRLTGSAALAEISHVRFNTRWDFSVRATLVLQDGRRIRLPQEATPPHAPLAAAFEARGIRCERHHFSPF